MMKNDENLNKQPHWRCRLCGHSTPLGQAVCSNPSCRADLGIYGETVTPGQEDTGHRAWKQQEEEAQQRKDEAQRQKAEEPRRRAEEKARSKADRPTDRSGGGAPKWLVPALAVVLVAAIGIGAGVFFTGRSTAGTPVPPRSSADPGPTQTEQPGVLESDTPGPDESRPGQGEPPASDAWRGNVLMADPLGDGLFGDAAKEYPAFGSQFQRQNICSITFLDSLDDLHGTEWDVSQAQDGSVMAWADLTSKDGEWRYDLYIGAEGGVEAPVDCSRMFSFYVNVERISFNGAFHTANTVDLSEMFKLCEGLTSLDMSSFDTSNVTNMCSMFRGCSKLSSLNITNFKTSNVTNMEAMFNNCSSLRELDVSGFDTSNVTDMSGMFVSCSNLAQLDLSSFDTSSVTDMGYMFYRCSGLSSLNITNFKTSNVTDMKCMFCECSGLRELDVSSFDTSNVINMSYMFKDCSGLAELDITNFKTSNVKNMSHMFAGVNSGFALHFVRANFDTSNVENYEGFMDDSFDWRKIFE